MKVIMRKDVSSLGKLGEVVKVSDGHARNYLIPQGLCYLATDKNMKKLEEDKKLEKSVKEKEKSSAEGLKEKIEGISFTITRQGEQENKIFGSITSSDIADALKAKGIEVDKKKVELSEHIKEFGIYTVPVRIHADVLANAKIWVVKE